MTKYSVAPWKLNSIKSCGNDDVSLSKKATLLQAPPAIHPEPAMAPNSQNTASFCPFSVKTPDLALLSLANTFSHVEGGGDQVYKFDKEFF